MDVFRNNNKHPFITLPCIYLYTGATMNLKFRLCFFLIVLASVTSATQAKTTAMGKPITRSVDLAFTGIYELDFQLTPEKNLRAGAQRHGTRLAKFTISSKQPYRLGFRIHPTIQEDDLINSGIIKGRADPKHILKVITFSEIPNTVRGDKWMISTDSTTHLKGDVSTFSDQTIPADIYTLIMEASAFVS